MKKRLLIGAAWSALMVSAAQAQHVHHGVLGPIGVMGDHLHQPGELMIGFQFGTMNMKGNRDGTDDVTPQDVLQDFMVTPLDMRMDMHMIGAMYGITERITGMVMLPWKDMEMDHLTRMGGVFTTETSGLGDIRLSSNINLLNRMDHTDDHATTRVNLNLGLSLPTGSIDKKDQTPMGYVRLPYPMQLGSGTIDPTVGLTATHSKGKVGLGVQTSATLRLYDNSNGYRLGNEYRLGGWTSYQLLPAVSASLRLDGEHIGNIKGRDPLLNPMMIPTARTDLRGGTRVNALAGVSFTPDALQGSRLGIEFGAPLYERLDGPQLSQDYRLRIGIQHTF